MSDSESQPTSEDHRMAAHRVNASRVWGVLIGINAYPPSSDCSPLRGCVNDVKKMEEFLTKDLGVPERHIQCLLSPIPIPSPDPSDTSRRIDPEERRAVTSPIRKNIIDTLLGLSTDSQILHGDNIIIYFSGHGSSYDLSDFDKSGDISAEGFIEALCPVDRTSSDTDVSIPDISDREINTILAEISRKKGNHITFILDCCHSSGASRNPSQPLNVVRRAPSLPATSIQDMLDAAHTRLKNLPKYRSVFKGNWKPDMTSHVVLAACEAFQYALEKKEGADNRCNGIFTQALIKVLKSDSSKELESTYVDLIGALKMPPNSQQTPVVAGNMNARLWYQPEMNKYRRHRNRQLQGHGGLPYLRGCLVVLALFVDCLTA